MTDREALAAAEKVVRGLTDNYDKIFRIIIEQIPAQRDELRAENKRLREQNDTQTQECEAHNNAYVYAVNEALGLRAEIEQLREAIKRLRDENPSTDDLCVLTFSLPALQALWAMIEEVKEEK